MNRSPSERVQWKDAPNYTVKEEAFSGNAPLPNRLWKILQRDEYDLLSNAPMLEGNFVQVTKKGEHISILNHPTIITVGVLATNPKLPFPDLVIIARERRRRDRSSVKKDLEITRLVSLEMVEMFLDNLDEQRIKVQMMKGQTYYLRLYAPGQDENLLFDQWLRLIYLMHLARGRIKRPQSFTFKEPGQRSTSILGLSTKKHWLPAVMDQSSTGRLKAQLCQIHSSKETQCSVESSNASMQSLLKPDLAAYSLSPLATSGGRQRASKGQPLYSRDTKRSQAPQAGSSNIRKPESKERSKPKQMSPQLTSKRTLESATGHPQTQVMSKAVASSPAAHQTSATTGSSQMKNVKQPFVMKPGNVPVFMTSRHSRHTPVKLQKSKKNRALIESRETKRKKATVKSQNKRPVPPKSLVPPTQDRHGAASKTSSIMRKKSSSRLVSSTMGAGPSEEQVGAGPSEKLTVSEATGSSEAILVSIASGPSRTTPQGTQVVAEVCGSAKMSREPCKPMSRRPKASSSPSPMQGRSTSANPTEEEENLVALRRTMESVAVGPSQVGYTSVAVGPSTADDTLTSRPQSRPLGTEKRTESGDRSRGQKVKDKKRNQPSSKTGKKKKSRSKESGSKSKLKSAMSSTKQKSSITFVTLYSVLSLSLEKMKRSLSKDDSKDLSRKPSKRVTISGVDGPSGKGVQKMEEVGDSAKNRLSTSPRADAKPVGQK